MRRPSLLVPVALCAAVLLPGAARPTIDWYTSVDEATEAARESGRDVLVDLYAEWCLWCSRLEENVFSRDEFRDALQDRYVFLRVDTEQEEGADLQRRFRVASLPTTLLMTPEQVEIGRIAGYFPVGPFLQNVGSEEESYRRFLERYETESAEGDSDTLVKLAEDLYRRGDGLKAAKLYRKVLPETHAGSAERARLAYEIAESLRRGGALDEADRAYREAEEAVRSAELEGSDLAGRLELLRFHIDHDRGECREALGSLERFLEHHPKSPLAAPARSTLLRLKQSESCA